MEDVYDLLAGRVEELLQQRGPGCEARRGTIVRRRSAIAQALQQKPRSHAMLTAWEPPSCVTCRAPKFMVGVAGVPGSGKSSLAKAVVELLNQRGTPAVNVPMVSGAREGEGLRGQPLITP